MYKVIGTFWYPTVKAVLASFPIAVIKISDKINLRKEGYISFYSWRVHHRGETMKEQVLRLLVKLHPPLGSRKQRMLMLCEVQGPSLGNGTSLLWLIFLPQLSHSRASLSGTPRGWPHFNNPSQVCLEALSPRGDPRFCQIQSQHKLSQKARFLRSGITSHIQIWTLGFQDSEDTKTLWLYQKHAMLSTWLAVTSASSAHA